MEGGREGGRDGGKEGEGREDGVKKREWMGGGKGAGGLAN